MKQVEGMKKEEQLWNVGFFQIDTQKEKKGSVRNALS